MNAVLRIEKGCLELAAFYLGKPQKATLEAEELRIAPTTLFTFASVPFFSSPTYRTGNTIASVSGNARCALEKPVATGTSVV
jgi:hypothetical protein